MENEKEVIKNEIVYDEGFQRASRELKKTDELEPVPIDEQKKEEIKERPKPLLITIQLVLCLLSAFALFLLKTTGSGLYDRFESWYEGQMSRTLISQSAFDSFELNKLFPNATPDETPSQGN